jgi:hypothetical protein
MNIPGANRDTINIEFKGNTLVATGEIRATMRENGEGNEMTRIKSERKIGKWRREIALPQKYVSCWELLVTVLSHAYAIALIVPTLRKPRPSTMTECWRSEYQKLLGPLRREGRNPSIPPLTQGGKKWHCLSDDGEGEAKCCE